MKQYTDKDQTAKLIELGFPKPTRIMAIGGFPPKDTLARYASYKDDFDSVTCYEGYSIGELIEFLQLIAENNDVRISTQTNLVSFDIMTKEGRCGYSFNEDELIDSLYEACRTLKEEK